ncbi:MAG: DUF1595 domain-containing protein, partial [Deltaproteobacteria bacterium]|nr:DUF1595 domain-containing protein [Deltaproteobacteria bacterium]
MKFSLYLGTLVTTAVMMQACSGVVSDGDHTVGSGGIPGTGAVAGTGPVTGSGGGGAGVGGTGGTGGTGPLPGTGGAAPGTGGTFVSTASAITPTIMRLSSVQWANSIRDLLKLPSPGALESEVRADAVVRFDNEADSLFVDLTMRNDLEKVAERLASQVVADAAAIARLVPAGAPTDAAGRAKAFIQDFGRRAYRRPLTASEIQEYAVLFTQAPTLTTGMGIFEAGMRVTLEAFLQSPHFLYRTAIGGTAVQKRARLTDYEIATNISYALTNSMPDDVLAKAADLGELKTSAA